MAIQTQSISKYIRDTEYNILRSDKSVSGVWSFAVDTGNIFLTYQGSLLRWNPQTKKLSKYKIGDYDCNCNPILHVDANDTSTLRNQNYQTPADGDNITEIHSLMNGGASVLEQPTSAKRPVFLENALGSGLNSVRFKNGAQMLTDDVFNSIPLAGGFTVFMVLRLLPTWDNLSTRGKTDTTPGDNEWLIPEYKTGSQLNTGLFHGTVNKTGTPYSSYIGAGLRWYTTNNNWIFEPGISGNQSYQGDNQETDLTNRMWKTGVDPLANHDGEALKDTIILCYEFPDVGDNTRGGHFIRVSTCGMIRYYDTSVYAPCMIKGFTVGRWSGWFTGDGGHFDLGEMMVFNNNFSSSTINNIGTHLSTKWSTPWLNFE